MPTQRSHPTTVLPTTGCLALLATGLIGSLPAQQFLDLRRGVLPADVDPALSLAVDLDGDGRDDLISAPVTGLPTTLHSLRNMGDGTFAFMPGGMLAVPDFSGLPATADIDGDQILDLLVPRVGGLDIYQQQPGGFTWALQTSITVGQAEPDSVTVADFDGDSDLDLLLLDADAGYWNTMLLQTPGGWLDVTASHLPGGRTSPPTGPMSLMQPRMHAVDIDGDSDVDLVGQGLLLLNDGTGLMSDASATLVTSYQPEGTPTAVDVDMDGDIDLLVSEDVSTTTMAYEVLLNDGLGTFSSGQLLQLLRPSPDNYPFEYYARQIAAGMRADDFDGDGLPDVLVPSASGLTLLHNQGSGTFGVAWSRPELDNHFPIQVLDLDGDGARDVLSLWTRFLANDGAGNFVERNQPGSESSEVSVAFDRTGDGFPDLLRGTNDSTGHIRSEQTPGWVSAPFDWTDHGDVDGDGDLDLIVNDSYSRRVFLNDGTGGWSLPIVLGLPTGGQALADLDGDGDLDLVTQGNPPGRVWFNDGAGNFTAATQWTGYVGALPVAGDVDGDGDPDVMAEGTLLLNDGTGNLTNASNTLPAASGYPELADVDGDGDLDAYISAGYTGVDTIWLNDGSGTFTLSALPHIPTLPGPSYSCTARDVDHDGDVDLLVEGFAGFTPYQRLLRNDGTGMFAMESLLGAPHPYLYEATVADVDRDGDEDIVVGDWVGTRVFVNRHRQLHAPLAPVLGSLYQLEIHASPGYDGQAIAVVGMSLTELNPSVEVAGLGLLRIDPTTAFLTAPYVVPAAGTTLASLAIPLSPTVLGLRIHSQAVIADTELGLSNLVVDEVGR